MKINCANCGKSYLLKPSAVTGKNCCSYRCSGQLRSKEGMGAGNNHWKGGRVVWPDGRILVRSENKKYILEYRLIAEKKLGRSLLPEEIVHHANGDPSDNRPENLEVMTQAEHARIHGNERRDSKTGRFKQKETQHGE